MPATISLRLDDRELRRNIRRLSDTEARRVMADALNKTSFEVLDAEKAEVRRVFEFAGASTERFLSGRGSFRFDGARPERLESHIMPAPKTEEILAPHQAGATLRPGKGQLSVAGKLAIPVVKRGARGRVSKRYEPQTVLRGRGFVAGRALLLRQRRGVRVLFALAPSVKLEQRFDFYRVARETAVRVFPEKARRAWEKLRLSR